MSISFNIAGRPGHCGPETTARDCAPTIHAAPTRPDKSLVRPTMRRCGLVSLIRSARMQQIPTPLALSLTIRVWQGRNSELHPERSTTKTLSADFTPIPVLSLGITYFDITDPGRIDQ